MKKAIVLGAGGFIGSHLVKRLKREDYFVRGIDLKYPDFSPTAADEFIIGDLRDFHICNKYIDDNIDEIYQLAADMGGAGYLFTGENDADVMHNSAMINLNVAKLSVEKKITKIFYSSSACIYPKYNQTDPNNPKCAESTAYPAMPDSEYGWEKLFSERLYAAFHRNYGLKVHVARFHNIFGIEGTWTGGKEKAPAAICRKVAVSKAHNNIEVWGDGLQTRSFLYIDDCIDAIRLLMKSDCYEILNIGSEEMISINNLAKMVIDISHKPLIIKNVAGPIGVRGRNSDNDLIRKHLAWEPKFSLRQGMELTYRWIEQQVENQKK